MMPRTPLAAATLVAAAFACLSLSAQSTEAPAPTAKANIVMGSGVPRATPLPDNATFIEREFRMTIPGSGLGLDALEVYINAPGKHPLALLTHGTSIDVTEQKQLTPWAQLSQALWFARRGYVAIVIIRRGYGISGGDPDTRYSGCRNSGSFQDAGDASADDLRAAVTWAEKNLPEVDTSTVISAGVSTGGFAQVALAAKPPANLKAAISFAGGRGGNGKEMLCNEPNVLDAFRNYGKKARTPMLWIYSENDLWFPPKFAAKFQQAFESKGGVDQFVHAPADGEDGHHLYSHIAAWSETVDGFLRTQKLLVVDPPYPGPVPPKIDPPAGLSERGQEGFRTFLILGPHKAFAMNPSGVYGFAAGMFNQQLADQRAMDNCSKNVRPGGSACQVVARGK